MTDNIQPLVVLLFVCCIGVPLPGDCNKYSLCSFAILKARVLPLYYHHLLCDYHVIKAFDFNIEKCKGKPGRNSLLLPFRIMVHR